MSEIQFNLSDVDVLLKQIEWQRYREGTYSSQDPLVAIKDKLRGIRTAIGADEKSNGGLNADELRLLLHATLNSINHINSYDYKLAPDASARLRESTLSPLLAITGKLRSILGEEPERELVAFEQSEALTDVEEEDLKRCEAVIERGLATFIEVGSALATIRDRRLYRIGYRTFEGYCQQRWNLSRVHAHRMIEAAHITYNLLPIGNKLSMVSKENHYPLPTCESQVRPLTRLEPEQQREVWQKAVETAPNGKVTAAHVQRTVELITNPPFVSHNAGDNEWYTPPEFIGATRDVMGNIDLDPASTSIANEVIQADRFYSKEDDGLSKDWAGKVWMNPPYASGLIDKFVLKLIGHVKSGQVTDAIVLVNNATETSWFSELMSVASAVCFPLGRVKFWAPDKVSAPLQGQAIIYIGNKTDKFLSRFQQFGWTAWIFKGDESGSSTGVS